MDAELRASMNSHKVLDVSVRAIGNNITSMAREWSSVISMFPYHLQGYGFDVKNILRNWLNSRGIPFDETTLIVAIILIVLFYFAASILVKMALAIIWPIAVVALCVVLFPTVTNGPMNTWIPQFIRIGHEVWTRLVSLLAAQP